MSTVPSWIRGLPATSVVMPGVVAALPLNVQLMTLTVDWETEIAPPFCAELSLKAQPTRVAVDKSHCTAPPKEAVFLLNKQLETVGPTWPPSKLSAPPPFRA